MIPAGGAGVLGRSAFGVGAGVGSERGVELCSLKGLGIGWPSKTQERDSIASRNVSNLSTSMLTTLGSPAKKLSVRAPKWDQSELTMMKRLAMVLKVTP